ncbi:MAG: YqeG family HAD IIIA-type phosphatase [bacterium]|nr:YqeG family HAD IIIA-type phosphatase [bacterium]
MKLETFVPDMYQKSIYTIDYQKLKNKGIKCILLDLNNTSVATTIKEPTEKLINLVDELKYMGFKVILFSNDSKRRLEPFKTKLMIDCCAYANKPRKDKFLKVLKIFNYNLSEVAIIGDQLYTDILGGNTVGITTILVNPVSHIDEFHTRILRYFERRKMAKLNKYGYFKKGKYYD